jgi:hypothetical protein
VWGCLPAHQLGEAKVEHLHHAIATDHHVGRFQVAVNDAAGMGGCQRVGHCNSDAEHLGQTHAVPRDDRIEALAPHVLHDEEVVAVGRLDFVNRDDVGVIERRRGLRLLHEPAPAILVRQPVGGQHLDCHLAPETGITRPVDLAHAPRAEEREHFVRSERRAGGETHLDLSGSVQEKRR